MRAWQSALVARLAHDLPPAYSSIVAWHNFRLLDALDHGPVGTHPATLIGGSVLDATLGLPLDGATQYATIANAADLSPGAGNMTWWYRFRIAAVNGYLLSKYGNGGTSTAVVQLNLTAVGTAKTTIRDKTSHLLTKTQVGASLVDGAEHTSALVRSGASASLYVDGALVGTDSSAALDDVDLDKATEPWSVGAFKALGGGYSIFVNGSIASRLQWAAALDATQIAACHAGGH